MTATSPSEYDSDFYAWTIETARRLRAGEIAPATLAQVADEIEDMGSSNRRALGSHLKVLMLHLLKWRHRPTHRDVGWRLSIANARGEIAALLRDSPSLRTKVGQLVSERYPGARRQAALETGLAAATFPDACPFSVDELLDDDHLPGDRP